MRSPLQAQESVKTLWFCETLVSPLTGDINPKAGQWSGSSPTLSERDWPHNNSSCSWLLTLLSGCPSMERKEHPKIWWPCTWLQTCHLPPFPVHPTFQRTTGPPPAYSLQHKERRETLWETPDFPTTKTNKIFHLCVVLPCLSKRNSAKQPDLARDVPAHGSRIGLDDLFQPESFYDSMNS